MYEEDGFWKKEWRERRKQYGSHSYNFLETHYCQFSLCDIYKLPWACLWYTFLPKSVLVSTMREPCVITKSLHLGACQHLEYLLYSTNYCNVFNTYRKSTQATRNICVISNSHLSVLLMLSLSDS